MPAFPNADAWATTEIIPDLGASDLYVFRVHLPVSAEVERHCYDVLNAEELERVGRFKHDLSRRHALAGRGVLRSLLGVYLGVPPRDVALRPGPNGKPEANGISCNVAHSGDVVLIALARSGLLGVDVERINEATPVLEIADRFFAPAEVARINAEPTGETQRAAFFSLWTRKEAILKADGRGLTVELPSFAAEDLTTVPDAAGVERAFRVRSLPIEEGYAAALATDQLSAVPKLFSYPGA